MPKEIQAATTTSDLALPPTRAAAGGQGAKMGATGRDFMSKGDQGDDEEEEERRRKESLTQPTERQYAKVRQENPNHDESGRFASGGGGGEVRTSVDRARICPTCKGAGSAPRADGKFYRACPTCKGFGSVDAKPLNSERHLAFLSLETLGAPQIVQEATSENGGRMRVRVPFYVGESISRAPGFERRIYFTTKILPGIIQEAKTQIAVGKQPLNVYARHAHAIDGDHLPIGAVVDVEQEGRIGYSIIELEPTVPDGVNAQILIRGKKLNAVSLRSRDGQFEMKETKVNGEIMLEPTKMAICGVDFAPDMPAMPTYGVEQLAAEAKVEPIRKSHSRRNRVGDLSLEELKSEHPDLVAEVEKPLKRQIESVTSERDSLLQEKRNAERDSFIKEIAGNFPDPEKALPLIQELCSTCKTKDEVGAKAMPVLLKQLKKGVSQEKPVEERIAALFPGGEGGAGDPNAGKTAEEIAAESKETGGVSAELAGGLAVPGF